MRHHCQNAQFSKISYCLVMESESIYDTCMSMTEALYTPQPFRRYITTGIRMEKVLGKTHIVCVEVRAHPIHDGLYAVLRGLFTVHC